MRSGAWRRAAARLRGGRRTGEVAASPPSQPARFVTSLYEHLIGRTPQPHEVAHWVREVERSSPEQVYFHFVAGEEYRRLREARPLPLFVPPGHFYSPIVDPEEIRRRAAAVFAPHRPLPGIDLRETEQLALVERLSGPYRRLKFTGEPQPGWRYFYDNASFGAGDAAVLGCLILNERPRQIIEVGSGYSSAVILDVVERLLDWSVGCTFIDPYPELFESLLRPGDRERIEVFPCCVQDVDLAVFDRLEAGDVLFIDSTHVVKTDSDVVHHVTRVLPRLKPGVLVHFHDIFYPFEYPERWVVENNQSWNELYYLQAFLTNNREYEILLFNDYLGKMHRPLLERLMPDFVRNYGGSLWLRKLPP